VYIRLLPILNMTSLFVRAESLNSRLNACGWPSAFINGAQDQMDRLSAMSKLKKFQCRVFISTDLVRSAVTNFLDCILRAGNS